MTQVIDFSVPNEVVLQVTSMPPQCVVVLGVMTGEERPRKKIEAVGFTNNQTALWMRGCEDAKMLKPHIFDDVGLVGPTYSVRVGDTLSVRSDHNEISVFRNDE